MELTVGITGGSTVGIDTEMDSGNGKSELELESYGGDWEGESHRLWGTNLHARTSKEPILISMQIGKGERVVYRPGIMQA